MNPQPKPAPRAKVRRWTCAHCGVKSEGKKCLACGIRRATKRSSLKARCDTKARELCRLLADGKCARCGGPGSEWAHRIARRFHSLRWSMENCDYLCHDCHRHFTDHPFEFTAWLTSKGVDVADLERRANTPWDKDYVKVLAYLSSFKMREAA